MWLLEKGSGDRHIVDWKDPVIRIDAGWHIDRPNRVTGAGHHLGLQSCAGADIQHARSGRSVHPNERKNRLKLEGPNTKSLKV